MTIKNFALLIILLAIILSIIVGPSTFAGGNPHMILGKVEDSLGNTPQSDNLRIAAYITVRPTDKIYYNVASHTDKIQYEIQGDGKGWWLVQCSDFSGWSNGEWLHLDFTDDGSDESASHEVQINEAVEPQIEDDVSLPVALSSFTASADNTKVTLKWETGSEVGNIGFYVYRGETSDGPFKKVSNLIEGAGNSAMGHTYEYLDKKVEPNKTYFYYLEDVDIYSVRNKSNTIQVTMPPPLPKEYKLFQNYPNPFNPETWIPFQLPKAGEVTIRIYNITGQLIKTIELGDKHAGMYIEKSKAAYWDGRNNMGEKLASGIYLYELRSETFRSIRRMILLK